MKNGYKIANTGAQIVRAPKDVSASSGVRGVRGQDLRAAASKNTKEKKK